MHAPRRPPRQPAQVTILFATAFDDAVEALLTTLEQRALLLLLADDPFAGTTVSGLPGLLRLPYSGTTIYYCLSKNFQKIYLLSIEPDDTNNPPPPKDDKNALRKILTGSTIIGISRGIKWFFDNL